MLRFVAAARVGDAADYGARSKSAVGPGVEIGIHLMRGDGAVTLDAGFQSHDRRVARRAGKKFLAVLHYHFDGSSRAHSQQIANRLVDGRAFAAEVAADGDGIDTNLVFRNAEGLRHAFLQAVRHLVGRPHLHPIAVVDPHQTTVRLEKRLVHARNRKSILNDHIRLGETLLDITASEDIMSKTIGRLLQRFGQSFVFGDIGMNDRRAFLQRRFRIEHGGKLLVIDLDKFQGILGLLDGLRRHSGNALAQKARAVLSEHRNVAIAPAVKNAAHVVAGQHGAHAGRFLSARNIDALNARMRVRAAQRLRPQSARQQHIGSVTRLAGDFAGVIDARNRLTDELVAHQRPSSKTRVMEYWSTGVLLHSEKPSLQYSTITPYFL